MGITRVIATTDPNKADELAGYYIGSGYKVVRIDKPDIIEMMKPGGTSQYWHSDDDGAGKDFILLIATTDSISIS